MLDLNYVRENLETVRTALNNRNFPTELLDEFANLDVERRRIIGESDKLNQLRNSSSKEIGALMQSGKRDEAEAKKAEVAGLKEKQSELDKQRDEAENHASGVKPHATEHAANIDPSESRKKFPDRFGIHAQAPPIQATPAPP